MTTSEKWDTGKRIRENVSMSAKGLAQIEITVELLNKDMSTLANNPKDVADLEQITIEDEIVKRVKILTAKLNEAGIRCTHQTE